MSVHTRSPGEETAAVDRSAPASAVAEGQEADMSAITAAHAVVLAPRVRD